MNTNRVEREIMNRYEDAKMEIHGDIGSKMEELRKQFEEQMAKLNEELAQRLADAQIAKNKMLGQVWSANPIDFDAGDEE